MRELRATDPVAVGPYRLLAELGRGGMGRVLLGAGPDGRLAAVKQVHARIASDEEFRARFRREVAASRRVSGAFTAAVTDADTEAETPWLASVFVTGPSLGTVVDRTGPQPEETVRRIAVGLATALVEMHRAGLVHRDLKPDNVLLADDGVRVIDFGIARATEGTGATELTESGVVVGSPAFMSPEQAEAKELTAASDVFSFGSVLAMAATGRSPFARESTLVTLYDLVHAEPDLSDVPSGLREVVAACLAKEPAERPDPERLLELLGPVAPGGGGRWPDTVRGLIADQQAEVDRVLGAPERTVLDLASRSASGGTGAWVEPPVATTAVDAVAAAAADPVRPRLLRRMLVAASVVVLAGMIPGIYTLWPEGEEGPKGDVYAIVPTCEEMAEKLPLPTSDLGEKHDLGSYSRMSDSGDCLYTDAADEEHAWVSWWLFRPGTSTTGPRPSATTGLPPGAAAAKADLLDTVKKVGGTAGPGPGEESYWDTAWSDGTGCRLDLRDGNMTVLVRLSEPEHPADTCRAEAERIADAVLSSMPH
ncbi:serine/threonine-protein kinase [Streptomyces ossamyceticus]|uniref:serine/threonine-protein kinase n=1 Tax=Streptomyces ossamyceticus TaxID=249581 RepID=UPI0006E32732|nr:serine/threonine-protein kinase [Streptomyces ossamyceticus]